MKKWKIEPTEEQIIKRIAKKDLTGGSCSSAALSFAGNRAGYKVKDFRGGTSGDIFASRKTIEHIAKMDNV